MCKELGTKYRPWVISKVPATDLVSSVLSHALFPLLFGGCHRTREKSDDLT